jgi:hypothetical protein
MHKAVYWIVGASMVFIVLGMITNGYFAYQCMQSGDPRSKECFMMSVMQSQNQNVTIWEGK